MRKATKIGFIAVFCAAVGLTFPVFNIFSKQLSMDSHENRLMTGLPQVLQSPLSQLPRSLDNFFVDNSPFRCGSCREISITFWWTILPSATSLCC